MTDLITSLLHEAPVETHRLVLSGAGAMTRLIIVDEVNGFAAAGGGNLAPPNENAQVTRMIDDTDRLARCFTAHDWPIFAFLDIHEPGKLSAPLRGGKRGRRARRPTQMGGGDANAMLFRKDCINGFIGAIGSDGRNAVVDWVNRTGVRGLLVVGICTDICVMDFVLTMLSARNHAMMPRCETISVHEGACANYDLPREASESLGLPAIASHLQELTHYMGLYFMAARGARILSEVEVAV